MPAISKMAPVLAVALVAIVIFVVFMADNSGNSGTTPGAELASGVGQGRVPAGGQPGAQAMRPAQSPNPAENGAGGNAAPMLEGLVSGLEAKVKADPTNLNNKLLLAQTYAELGRFEDGVSLLRELQSTDGSDGRVKLVAAMVLAKSENPEYLNEALQLLGDVAQEVPAQKGQAILHKGRVLKKMGKPADAKTAWQEGVAQLPENDPLRKEIEKELANI